MATEGVPGEDGRSEGEIRGTTQSVPTPPQELNGSITNESKVRLADTLVGDKEQLDVISNVTATPTMSNRSTPQDLISATSSISSPTSSYAIPAPNPEQPQASNLSSSDQGHASRELECRVCGTTTPTSMWRRGLDGSSECNTCSKYFISYEERSRLELTLWFLRS